MYQAQWAGILLLYSSLSVSSLHAEEPITAITWPETISDEMRLGKKLFHDALLSVDRKTSCASCHQFDHGGAATEPLSYGSSGQPLPYNTPSVFNLAFNHRLGWTGKLTNLEQQMHALVRKKSAMGLGWNSIISRLQQDQAYQQLFTQVYGAEPTPENVVKAIAAYQRALTTPSSFDAYLSGREEALSEDAKEGYRLFKNYGCISCHQGRNVGGNLFQPFGALISPFNENNPPKQTDFGRFNHTLKEYDRYVFRVPSLRNVAETAPYFHDGSEPSLLTAIKTIALYQLGRKISEQDAKKIMLFLQSLSGEPHPELMP